MSQLQSKEEYEAIKNEHRAIAREKEAKIKRDLSRLMSEATPRYVREKLATSCIVFGVTYLIEELAFRKRVPGIVKFAGAVATTAFAPKIYRLLYRNYYTPVPADAPLDERPINGYPVPVENTNGQAI